MKVQVLIVEDEEVLRSSMVRGLAKLPAIEILDAANVDDACKILDQTEVDLVLSDIDLPGRTGIEIVGELAKRRSPAPVVFISAYVKSYTAMIPRHAQLEVFEKPVSIGELREIVERKLRTEDGDSRPFGVADFLQLAGMGRKTVCLQAKGSAGPGSIVVVEGKPWSASDAGGQGLAAFGRLAFAEAAECHSLLEAPPPQNLRGSLEALLMDAARLADEAARQETLHAAAQKRNPQKSNPPDDDVEFKEHWERGVSALLGKEYESARDAFWKAARLRPDDRRVATNLSRLEELGVVSSQEDPEAS